MSRGFDLLMLRQTQDTHVSSWSALLYSPPVPLDCSKNCALDDGKRRTLDCLQGAYYAVVASSMDCSENCTLVYSSHHSLHLNDDLALLTVHRSLYIANLIRSMTTISSTAHSPPPSYFWAATFSVNSYISRLRLYCLMLPFALLGVPLDYSEDWHCNYWCETALQTPSTESLLY